MSVDRANPTALFITSRGDRWVRGAMLRLACVAVFIALAYVDALRTASGTVGLALPLVALVPLVGTYWALLAALVDSSNNSGLAGPGRGPLDPLTTWAVRQTTETKGQMKLNASGVLEFLGAGVLGAGIYMVDEPRLAFGCLTAAVVYGGSITVNTVLDPAFYLPGRGAVPLEDVARVSSGLVVGLVTFAVTAWAFPADMRLAVAALCASLLGLGPRTRQTDQQMAAAGPAGIVREQTGRADILDVIHDLDSEVEALGKALQPLRDSQPAAYEHYQSLSVGLRETLVQDRLDHIDMDWPGVLLEWLRKKDGKTGVRFTFDYSRAPRRISPEDKRIARIALVNLVTNAIEAEAGRALVCIFLEDDQWNLSVTDDGRPIDVDSWNRTGGGVARLRRLADGLSVRHGDNPKTVTATWTTRTQEKGASS